MLRRAPTLITLTPEDVVAYDDSRLARLAQRSTLQSKARKNSDGARYNAEWASSGDSTSPGWGEDQIESASRRQAPFDPNDELKPLPGDKARAGRYGPVSGDTSGSGSGQHESSANMAADERERERTRTRNERIGVSSGR